MHVLWFRGRAIFFRLCIQGLIHFDGNGVRDTPELRVLQYRTDCIGTEVSCGRIKLVEVAHMNDGGKGLHFKEGDSNNIWPGYCIL
jgi:hypothetical protein